MSCSGVRRVSRTRRRSRSPRRSRRGRSEGKVTDVLLVVVPEEEAVGAFLAAEDAPHAAATAVVADPLEADGTLVEPLLLIVDATGDTVHCDRGPVCRAE